MKFTYSAYENLIKLLKNQGYVFTDYANEGNSSCEVILRHDVDYDLKKAVEFGEFEKSIGVSSTYFILLSGNFYNLFSASSEEMVNTIVNCGHKIGLHFDETCYSINGSQGFVEYVQKELSIMESIFPFSIDAVSMHRPSKMTLESDYAFGKAVNSYSKHFFKDYKYVSDSRMYWREDILTAVKEKSYEKLHILTHPVWYAETEETTKEKLVKFISSANNQRYQNMDNNFRDLSEFVLPEEI